MAKKKKEIEIINDFGRWNIPTRWEEVSLKQFVELMKKTENNLTDVRDVISIMTGKSIDEVNLLPYDFVESMMARLTFLNSEPKFENKNEIIINNEKYFINVMEKLKFGEYVDVNSAIQSDKTNYATFLAILCRKENETYDDDFIANVLDDRIEMFNNLPITEILPVIGFFLALYQVSGIPFQNSLTEGKQIIDQLLEQTERSWKTMGLTKRYSIWGMKTLWKLKKYRKQISQL